MNQGGDTVSAEQKLREELLQKEAATRNNVKEVMSAAKRGFNAIESMAKNNAEAVHAKIPSLLPFLLPFLKNEFITDAVSDCVSSLSVCLVPALKPLAKLLGFAVVNICGITELVSQSIH